MKIVCDACGAKYSIADEKVAGKVFKIRCKRCSNIIVVRGDADQAAAEPAPDSNLDQKETRVFDYSGYDNPTEAAAAGGDDAVWHVVIDQEQVGPMTAAEIGQRFAAGEIDADSYIWQEGFADWERLADVGEFAALAAGGGAAAAADDGNMFGGPPVDESQTAQNDPADLFAAAAGGAGADPGADLFAGGGDDAGSDLFGSSAGGADAGAGLAGLSAASESEEPKLKGQRNENSVLFSLSNLASLAGDSAPASSGDGGGASIGAAAAAAPSGGSKTTATQEGSGLIDIRSMAQVYLADGDSKPAASAGVGSDADIPSFSAASFDATASPMLLPTAPAQDDNKKLLFILLGVIGALSLAAIVLVVMVLSGDDKDEVASAGGDDSADAAAVGGDSDDSKPSDGKEPGESGAGGTDTNPEGGEDGNKPAETNGSKPADTTSAAKPKETTRKPKETTRKPKETTRKPKETSKPKETKPDPKPTSGCDEVTCLVEPNKACCRKYRSSKGSSKSNSNLKERPSKSDVKSGIARVMGRVRACGSKHGGSGLVKVRVKVSGSGRVSSASPSPGGALGRCVASAVKRARFPKTQRGVTFTYPFRF